MPKRKRGSIGYRRPKKKKVEGAETVEEEPEEAVVEDPKPILEKIAIS